MLCLTKLVADNFFHTEFKKAILLMWDLNHSITLLCVFLTQQLRLFHINPPVNVLYIRNGLAPFSLSTRYWKNWYRKKPLKSGHLKVKITQSGAKHSVHLISLYVWEKSHRLVNNLLWGLILRSPGWILSSGNKFVLQNTAAHRIQIPTIKKEGRPKDTTDSILHHSWQRHGHGKHKPSLNITPCSP